MQASERDFAARYLEETRELVRGVASRVTEEQRNFTPAEDVWSIADCIQHLILTEASFHEMLEKLLAGPPDVENRGRTMHKDAVVKGTVPVRTTRVPAPAAMRPSRRWPDFDDLMRNFEAVRARTIRIAESCHNDLRCYVAPHPVLKNLDAYQWLVFLAGHSERHVRQAEEIMRHPAFPRATNAIGQS